jgi:hypothetical protein
MSHQRNDNTFGGRKGKQPVQTGGDDGPLIPSGVGDAKRHTHTTRMVPTELIEWAQVQANQRVAALGKKAKKHSGKCSAILPGLLLGNAFAGKDTNFLKAKVSDTSFRFFD